MTWLAITQGMAWPPRPETGPNVSLSARESSGPSEGSWLRHSVKRMATRLLCALIGTSGLEIRMRAAPNSLRTDAGGPSLAETAPESSISIIPQGCRGTQGAQFRHEFGSDMRTNSTGNCSAPQLHAVVVNGSGAIVRTDQFANRRRIERPAKASRFCALHGLFRDLR